MLQLSILLLEYAYQVMQACTKVTIDAQEFNHVLAPLRLLKRLSLSRVEGLKGDLQIFATDLENLLTPTFTKLNLRKRKRAKNVCVKFEQLSW